MKKRVQITNEVVPEFATKRVEDFLATWNPNLHSLKMLAQSLYCQGVADGFACGELFAASGGRMTDPATEAFAAINGGKE